MTVRRLLDQVGIPCQALDLTSLPARDCKEVATLSVSFSRRAADNRHLCERHARDLFMELESVLQIGREGIIR